MASRARATTSSPTRSIAADPNQRTRPSEPSAKSGKATIAIRPERVRLTGAGSATLKGHVVTRTFVSGQVHYRVRLDTGRELAAKANEGAGDVAIDAEVGVDWAPGDVVVLSD